MNLTDVAITVLTINGALLIALCCGWACHEVRHGMRSWRVRRELTRVERERDREQLEWRRGF